MSAKMLSVAAKVGGVNTIAIVDDAYDPPKPSEISEDCFTKFVLAVSSNSELYEELHGITLLEEADIDDLEEFREKEKLIVGLWHLHVHTTPDVAVSEAGRAALKELFDDISTDRIEKLTQLKPLEMLLNGLEGEIIRLGSDPNPVLVAKADVVFLDLYLSEDIPSVVKADCPVPRGSYDRARDRALSYIKSVREVTASDINSIAPAFILISSQGSDLKAENFRKNAGQMRSRFRFVSKQAINEFQAHEILAIVDIFRTCKACSVIEPIQKAWPLVSKAAIEWVNDKLLDLDISDFGHLYHLKLKEEGQSVTEYIKELVAGALSEQICHQYGKLSIPNPEESPFKDVPSFFQHPTNGFADLYSATRISNDKGCRGKSGFDPQSGDIFLIGALPEGRGYSLLNRDVIAVMSPQCDLLDRDGTGPSAKSILLLQGVIKPMTFKQKDPQLICHNDKYFEIAWDKKHPAAINIADFCQEWKSGKQTWMGRLKTEHFLALKNDYLNDLGRIGVIKNPVVYEALRGDISIIVDGRYATIDGSFAASKQFAFLFSDQTKTEIEQQQIAFSGAFVSSFLTQLEELSRAATFSATVLTKIRGILERKDQVVKMIEKKNTASHCIQNYLRVEVYQAPFSNVRENTDGIVIIRLWPE